MIWSITFFVWYTQSNSGIEIEKYKKNWEDEVFAAVEMLKQPYDTVVNMSVQKLKSLLKWKNRLEDEKEKIMKEIQNA